MMTFNYLFRYSLKCHNDVAWPDLQNSTMISHDKQTSCPLTPILLGIRHTACQSDDPTVTRRESPTAELKIVNSWERFKFFLSAPRLALPEQQWRTAYHWQPRRFSVNAATRCDTCFTNGSLSIRIQHRRTSRTLSFPASHPPASKLATGCSSRSITTSQPRSSPWHASPLRLPSSQQIPSAPGSLCKASQIRVFPPIRPYQTTALRRSCIHILASPSERSATYCAFADSAS